MMATKGYADLSLYRRLLHRVRPYGLLIAVMIVVDLLACALKLLTPVPLKIAVDSLVGQEASAGILARLMPGLSSGAGVILFAAVFLVVIALLGSLQNLASNYLHAWIGEKMVLDFRGQLFRHGQRLSLAYHDSVGTSDSTYRIQYDASSIQYIAIDGIIPFLTESFTVALMLFITLRLDWQLGLIALAITPVLFLVAKSYRKKLRKQSHEVKQLESSALSVVQEVLGALRVVKAFGQEDREQDRFVRYSRQGLKASRRLWGCFLVSPLQTRRSVVPLNAEWTEARAASSPLIPDREALTRGLMSALGEPVTVLERRLNPYCSTFPAEIITFKAGVSARFGTRQRGLGVHRGAAAHGAPVARETVGAGSPTQIRRVCPSRSATEARIAARSLHRPRDQNTAPHNVVLGKDPAITKSDGVGYGDSYVVDPYGEIVVRSRRHHEDFLFAEVDTAVTDRAWKVGRSLWSVQEFHKQLLDAAGIKG